MIAALLSLELAVGYSNFGHQPDGVWYQEPFAHTLTTRSPSFSVGVASKDYRFGYEYFGRVTTSALATPSDPDYNINGAHAKWPLSHWYGDGNVQGIYASRLWRSGNFFAETGLYVYRPTWSMTIPDWRSCETCNPKYIKVVHNPTLNATPIIGVGYKYGMTDVVVTVRQTQTRGDYWTAFYSGASTKAELRMRF
jgi:hypothetical protein